MESRSEKRLVISLAVRVYGIDATGKPFNRDTRTLDITHDGARLDGLPQIAIGETVGVQLGLDKARYKVIWVGEVGGKREGQIGLQVVEGSLAQWNKILDATPEQLRVFEQVSLASRSKTTNF